MNKFYSCTAFAVIMLLIHFTECKASTDTIPAGSYIINMGVTPQTIGNGLKPYGLVYTLVKNYKIPVKWGINSAKTKDGIDFTHNGINYRGGTFIITGNFRTPAINAVISAWEAQGVTGNTSVGDLVLDVFKTFYYAPNWMMDKANGCWWQTILPTPVSLHRLMVAIAPTGKTLHKNLAYWNQTYKGNIWAACHAVSELENTVDPVTGTQLNFLSTTGLVPWGDHKKDASPPYQYQDHGNPIMQFMQTLDQATNIGSEKTYLPKAGGAWRSTTTLGVFDVTNTNIPSLSNGPAAILAYGRAYGDNNRGWVMYEAGHDHPVSLSFSVPPGIDLSYYTIQWTSACGGSFSTSGNGQSVTFTPAVGNGQCIVTVTITDGCGREVFSSESAYVNSVLSSPNASLKGSYNKAGQQVLLNWSPTNNQSVARYEIQRSTDGANYKTIALFMPDQPTVNAVYAYKDQYIVRGAAFYRLLVINEAKGVSYSNIIKINEGQQQETALTVLSNPVRGNLAFQYQGDEAGRMSVLLMNISGAVAGRKQILVGKGILTVQMGNYSHLPAGVYVLRVTVGDKTVTQKVNLIK